jgi:hypothetical protein
MDRKKERRNQQNPGINIDALTDRLGSKTDMFVKKKK